MKAVIVAAFGPVASAEVRDVPDPVAGPGEVVVAMRAADVNYPDILVMEGRYQVKPPLPFSPGKAGAGVIAALGAGVTGFAIGDRVAVQVEYGAYAEKVVAPAGGCLKLPDDIGFAEAAALGLVYQTSYYALVDRGAFRAGDSVLVLGASGGVGVAAVGLAKALGAGTVLALTSAGDGADVARAAGADVVIDRGMDNLRDGLKAAVLAATGGQGADVVIDPVGGAATEAALRALAWRGRLVVVGFAAGDIPTFRANYLLVKNITVSGLQWSDYRDRDPEGVAQVQAEIFALRHEGRLPPVPISRVLPLDQFADALEQVRAGKARGKVILSVGEGG
jgi:NADPH2:quinone reductase